MIKMRMKRIFGIVVILLVVKLAANAGIFTDIQSTQFHDAKVVWAADNFKQCVVVVIQLKNVVAGESEAGTGVFLNNNNEMVVITNNHIVSQSSACVVGFLNRTNRIGFVSGEVIKRGKNGLDLAMIHLNPDTLTTRGYLSSVIKSTDESRLNDLLLQTKTEDDLKEFWDRNKLLMDSSFAEAKLIKPGRQVFFMGFPLGDDIFDKDPVFRAGYISSVPRNGFFWIDAMVNHGNSGSPVFAEQITESATGLAYSWKLIGIISSFDSDYVDYKSETGETIRFPHNAGLARVIDIRAILNFMR